MRGRLQSARQSMHAKQRERAKRKSATLRKLYNRPKKASERPHSLQYQEKSRIVVLLVCVAVVLLMSRPASLHPFTTRVAAK
jgi:hypothetical protein